MVQRLPAPSNHPHPTPLRSQLFHACFTDALLLIAGFLSANGMRGEKEGKGVHRSPRHLSTPRKGDLRHLHVTQSRHQIAFRRPSLSLLSPPLPLFLSLMGVLLCGCFVCVVLVSPRPPLTFILDSLCFRLSE
jgi:hypothetical protein